MRRLELAKHKQVEFGLNLVRRTQGVKLKKATRKEGLELELASHIREVLELKLVERKQEQVSKVTTLVELKVKIVTAAVIEEADNIEEVVVAELQAVNSIVDFRTIYLKLQHVHFLLLDLTISVVHELETLICCGIEKEGYRTRLDCNVAY